MLGRPAECRRRGQYATPTRPAAPTRVRARATSRLQDAPRCMKLRHADRLRHPSWPRRDPGDAAALSRRPLARAGHEPRHRRAGPDELSPQHAAVVPARLAAQAGQARQQLRDAEGPGARRLRLDARHLQRPLRRPGGLRSLHGGRLLPRHQRLDRGRVAGARFPPQGLHRRADAGAGSRRRGDRAARGRSPFRVDPRAGAGRDAARRVAISGRSIRRPSATSCRSPFIPAASTAWRRARSAGHPIGSSTTSPRRRRIRPSC